MGTGTVVSRLAIRAHINVGRKSLFDAQHLRLTAIISTYLFSQHMVHDSRIPRVLHALFIKGNDMTTWEYCRMIETY